MEPLFIFILAAAVVALCIICERTFRRRCKKCGTLMDRYYDPEEDAEVYQCPNCGNCYLVK